MIKKADSGRFEIICCPEENYPGVDIEFVPEKEEDRERVGPTYPRIVFERPRDGKLRLLVWADANKEDPSHKFEWDI